MNSGREKFIPQEWKTSIIQICGYEERNFRGILQNAYYTEQQTFGNLTQLLFMLDQLQDTLCYPQKGMETRRFKGEGVTLQEMTPLEGTAEKPLATFKLSILFRQNASWQGTVVWMEERREAPFRSVLELISLMDSVLRE